MCGCSWPSTKSKTQSGNKRVESSLVACLDGSSTLPDSTKKTVICYYIAYYGFLFTCLFLFLEFSPKVQAQQNQLYIEKHNVKSGLPESHIRAIYKKS